MSKIRTNTFTARSATPVALAVLAVLAAAPVAAQEEAAGSMLEEIVVTAQKRSQNIQDVPVAVSYVAGDTIEARGGLNAEALKTLVPSLNVRKTNTSINQALFLRGVGTINFAIAAQPSVASVLDGVVLTSAGEAFGDLYDVERVEVLRGPQGTLFGKNASAGVINIISKRPGDSFAGYVDLGWYEEDEMRVKASLDTPLSSTVKGRTTVNWGQYDGYIDNISTTPAGGKLNGYDHQGIRTLWVATPSDAVELTFIGDYRKADDNCCAEIIGTAPAGTNGAALNSLLSGVDFLGIDTREIKQNLEMRSEEEAWGLSVQADIGLSGDRTLTSITAYRVWDSTEIREGDWLDRAATYVGNAFAQLHDFGPQDTDTISQELRIASPGGEKMDYVAGVYFARTDAHRFFERAVTSCTASTLPPDATGVAPCTPAASTIVSASSSADFGAKFKTLAVFGDATFNLQERMRVIAGIRWTQDDLSYFHNRVPSPIAGLPGIRTDTTGFTGEDSSSNWSGRLGLQFGLTDDIMLYTTYARGYKGPAFNVFFNMVANDKQVIDAETANAYEVGLKTTLFDGKLLFNSALFYAEYDNFQANNYLLLNGVVITTLTNAGKVQTEGLELDFLARPTDNLSISGGWAYTDAHVAQFFTPPGQPVRVRNGTALPLAPTYKGSLAIDYRIPLASFDIVPNLAYSHQSQSFADLNEPAALRLQGYETFDLSVTFATKDDRYRLMLVGRNLFDESSAAMATAGGPGGSPRLQIPRDADRYFGAQFRAQFGGK